MYSIHHSTLNCAQHISTVYASGQSRHQVVESPTIYFPHHIIARLYIHVLLNTGVLIWFDTMKKSNSSAVINFD